MLLSPRVQLVMYGGASALLYAGIALLSQQFVYGEGHSQRPILAFLALSVSAFVFYVVAIRLLSRASWRHADVLYVLGFAVLFRGVLLFSNPIQEDDFYRYLWDGKVVTSGLNLYGIAPSAIVQRTERSRDYAWIVESDPSFALILSRINHPWVPTIYPPLAQGIFAFAALVAPGSLLALRLVFFIFDLGLCLLLVALLRNLGSSTVWVLVYAWSPLVVKETINSAHYDVAPTFFLVLSAALMLQRHWLLAYVGLACATLGKLYPLFLLPLLMRRTTALFGWPRALSGIGVVVPVVMAGYFPFLEAGAGLWQGTVTFAKEWQTNSFAFPLLLALVGNRWQANLLMVIGLGGVLVALLRWNDVTDERAFLWSLFAALGALFLCSPVGNPWYFLWIVPFLCVFPLRSWLLLSGLLVLYYSSFFFLYHRMAKTFRLVLWLEYVPFYSLLFWEWHMNRRTHAAASLAESTHRVLL